jgi:hypothetical protein
VRLRSLLAVALADARERLRRYSFLVAMGSAVYFGYLIEAGYVTLTIAGRRGVMNSAWVGTLTALALDTMLPLVGFYFVKNTLERDRQTGVGEILAASPLTRLGYAAGKALSNLGILSALAAVPVAAAILLQLTAGEDRRLDLFALAAPVLWLTLPALALVAALAVLFECVRWLRGAFGNVLFFGLWSTLLVLAVENAPRAFDVAGIGIVYDSLFRHLRGRAPSAMAEQFTLQIGPRHQDVQATFPWDGLHWSPALAGRLLVVLTAALAVVLVAALTFDRFDPAAGKPRREVREETVAPRRARRRLPHVFAGTSFGGLVAAELRLMLAGRTRWWTLIGLGLLIAGCVAPLEASRTAILPIAWLWPLAVWSGMGAREAQHGTGSLIFCSPRPISQHALAMWTAGVVVTILAGLGPGVRMASGGDLSGSLSWVAACAFIPGLALALGSWSGGSRLFEVSYLLLWYIGPLNHVPSLDFMGVSATARTAHAGVLYLALSVALLALAIAGRQWQARRSTS